MNDQIKTLVSSFTTSYESYRQLLGEGAIADLSAIYQEMIRLAESSNDLAQFSAAAVKADLFNRFSQEMQKVAGRWQQQQQSSKRQEITIETIRNQAALLLKDAEAKGILPTLTKVYEENLKLAGRATDPAEYGALAEKAGIYLRMATAPVFDSYQLEYERSDPNEEMHRAFHREAAGIAQKAITVDELASRLDSRALEFAQAASRESFLDFAVLLLTGRLLSYYITLTNIRNGMWRTAPEIVSGLMILRAEISNLYNSLRADLEIDWQELSLRDQKRIIFQGSVFPSTDRAFMAMDPANLEWMKECLFEEVLSKLTIPQSLTRKPSLVFNPVPESDLRFDEKARQLAKPYVQPK